MNILQENFSNIIDQKYFKMKQDFHTKKTPMVIRILVNIFGEQPPYRFKDVDQRKLIKYLAWHRDGTYSKELWSKIPACILATRMGKKFSNIMKISIKNQWMKMKNCRSDCMF